jgi:hypothetical protein
MLMHHRWLNRRISLMCASLCLVSGYTPCVAWACEGFGDEEPQVLVSPKTLTFKELKALESEEKILTYKNDGPGGWQPTEFKFGKVEGELGAWGVALGATPCNKKVPEGGICEEKIIFEPKVAGAGKIKANVTTNPASQQVVVEGKGK